jgi:hypothetical protein
MDLVAAQCRMREVWIAPEKYALLEDEQKRKLLTEQYPKGFKAVFLNGILVEIRAEQFPCLAARPLNDVI